MKKSNRLIASLLVVIMLISALMFSLASCKPDKKDEQKPDDGPSGGSGKTESYSVSVVTKGGMKLTSLPIYVFEMEDGSLGEMVEDGGYAATDENGTAVFNLPEGKDYAARIDISIPKGYDVQPYYPLVSKEMTITVSSSVISDTNLVGVSYGLGSVMHDFTVNSTILVENENGELEFKEEVFTLSEALKTKKAVLINFWYTTCSWCITEFPLMQDAYEKYADDLAIIALDPYTEDTLSMIQSFQGEMQLTFNVAQENMGLNSAFGVEGYPTSVIVDRYGVVAMIEAGAITSERAFDVVFDHFTKDNYEQKLIVDYSDIVPKEKPNLEMPSAEEFGQAFEKEDLGNINYRNDTDDEYSWPFITGTIGDEEISVVYPTNAKKEGSYAQLLFDIDLEAGQALAFDYFASTERGADILYVVVNGKDIYSISGESSDWATCYAYVAEETGTYEVGIVYAKDSSDDVGQDTV